MPPLRVRQAFEKKVETWRHLRHNHVKTVWGYIRSEGETYTVSILPGEKCLLELYINPKVGPCMKHWDLNDYLMMHPPVDRFNLVRD